jgi:allantoinase
MAYAYLSKRLITPTGERGCIERDGALLVEDGVITAVCGRDEVPAGFHTKDFGDAVILPGLVDTHVHINEPGRTEWEGFATATRAAAAGGYTTLVDMPLNCIPETTTVEALAEKRAAAAGLCMVDWAAWGGAVADNQEHLEPLAAAGVPGYKCFLIYPGCEGFTMIDLEQLERALPHIAKTGLPLLVHAELAGPIDIAAKQQQAAGVDWRRYDTYLASRPDEAELEAITLMLGLCRKYKFRLHIVHLSTAKALPMLREAKAEGLPVTVETCPHYLHFRSEWVPNGATQFKCAPPIRSAANCDALWEGLRAGIIDMVVTDHSPCPPEMKKMDEGLFNTAWGGIASLSVALPVMWTDCVRRGFSLVDLSRWMSTAPAALAGLSQRVGSLEAGRDANFVVFDERGGFTVRPEDLHYRHKISPYMGERLRGVVKATYLRGEVVFENGAFADEVRGREYAVVGR